MFYSKRLSKFKDIKHCFFSRKKGFSKGIYKSLNCGIGSKDNKNNITKNLNFVANSMAVKRTKLKLMYQTHSNKVIEINNTNFNKSSNFKRRYCIISKYKGLRGRRKNGYC